jgi:predicted DNA-binding transcriptional regulator AlpA
MSEPSKTFVVHLTIAELEEIIGGAVQRALSNGAGNTAEKETLLTPEQAAAIIGVDIKWLYRHSKQLPFTRRLSRKKIRFNESGLRRWLAARK